MATGIQGPQGYKGARGVQGATGWGAIGEELGPTGPTGPIGYFRYLDTRTADGTLTLSGSTVSTLYKVTTGSQGAILLNIDGSLPIGGFHVFNNQTNTNCIFSATGSSYAYIDETETLVLPTKKSVMLIRQPDVRDSLRLVSSYPYSGVGSTGSIGGL